MRFKKCEYELINAEDPLVLVHYMGDETVWKPFRHIRSDRPSEPTMKSVRNTPLDLAASSRPSDLYQTTMMAPPPEGYDAVATPRDREQVSAINCIFVFI